MGKESFKSKIDAKKGHAERSVEKIDVPSTKSVSHKTTYMHMQKVTDDTGFLFGFGFGITIFFASFFFGFGEESSKQSQS